MPRRIVIALDQSDYSTFAFYWTLDNILQSTDQVQLITACTKETTPQQRHSYAVTLDEFAFILDEYGITSQLYLIQSRGGLGQTARLLAEQAKGADLLVVGAQGKSAIRRALVGSTSTYCALYGAAHVLVVRAGSGADVVQNKVTAHRQRVQQMHSEL